MPNQSDPNSPTQNTTDQPVPAGTSPVVPDFQTTDLTPIPANDSPQPIDEKPEVPNESGSSTPPEMPPVISTTPKKKFGGGKIIATILGFLILVGGIAAGTLLTRQKQILKEKAFTTGGPYKDTCNLIEVIASDTGCPQLSNNTGSNNIPTYTTHFTIKNTTNRERVVSIIKHSNYCLEAYGQPNSGGWPACQSNPVDEPGEITLAPGESKVVTIERSSTSGQSCGSYQTDLVINSIDGNSDCKGPFNTLISWGLCQTGTECVSSTITPTPTSTATATGTATATSTSTSTATATSTSTSTASATATSTSNPTGTPNLCGGTCGSNSNCGSTLMCYQGFCRNPSCVAETDCTCPGVTGPTATPASLPQSGTSWPTIFGAGLGILVILGSLLLAL